jgi:signal transduction protein with GAF and PtsI domain
MEQRCLSASFIVQNTEFKQFEEKEERFLLTVCEQAMHTLEQSSKTFQQTVQYYQKSAT